MLKEMHYQNIFNGEFNETNLMLWMLVHFPINLVKVREVLLGTKPK